MSIQITALSASGGTTVRIAARLTDSSSVNGWKFVAGGEIASGVPHANLETFRFPDINGDGRADYVYIGQGGALNYYLYAGTVVGQDVLFHPQGGIATGAVEDISMLVFADVSCHRSRLSCFRSKRLTYSDL